MSTLQEAGGLLLTMAETCARLRLSRWTIRKLVALGELEAVKGPFRNSPLRIKEPSVSRYLARRTISPPLADGAVA